MYVCMYNAFIGVMDQSQLHECENIIFIIKIIFSYSLLYLINIRFNLFNFFESFHQFDNCAERGSHTLADLISIPDEHPFQRLYNWKGRYLIFLIIIIF